MRQLLARSLCALLLGVAAAAHADFPDRPIRLIVPYDPGTVDAVARVLATGMSDYLKVPVIVENMAGANSIVGTARAAKAPADGYTVLYGSQAGFVQNQFTYKLPYDPGKDFTPVSYGVNTGLFLVVNKSLGVKTLQEFVALAKANPGKFTYGSSGIASSGHVAAEVFARRAGIDVRHIPYKSSTTVLTDLLADRVSFFYYTYSGAEQYIRNGNLLALAYTGKNRLAAAPDVPTVAESGYPGYDQTLWFSFFVPAGTPKEVVARLNEAVRFAAKDQEQALKKFYDYVPMPDTPEQMGDIVRDETERFRKLMTELNIKAQ